MFKKMAMLLCLCWCIFGAASAEPLLECTDSIVVDCPQSTFSKFIQNADGSMYLMGNLQENLQDWVSLASADGVIQWTVYCPEAHYFSGMAATDSQVCVLVNEYGKPVEDRSMQLQPILSDGRTLSAKQLPSWTANAAMETSHLGILLYSFDTSPLRAMLLDPVTLDTVWEFQSPIAARYDLITDSSWQGDTLVLLAADTDREQNEVISIQPGHSEPSLRTLAAKGHAVAIAHDSEHEYILLEQYRDELPSYQLAVTDRAGKQVDSLALVSSDSGIRLSDMKAASDQIVLLGAQTHADMQPDLVIALLDRKTHSLSTHHLPEIKDLGSQMLLMDDNALLAAGVHAGSDGQADGKIILNRYEFAHSDE